MNLPNEPEPEAPARLIEDLRALDSRVLFVSATVDQRVLAEARRHLTEKQTAVGPWRVLRPRLALAACLAVLGLLAALFVARSPRFAREDLNRDGAVDIRDAFALARSLKTGATRDRAWDFNGDGVVDHSDVDILAAQAVRLPNGKPVKAKEAVGEVGSGNAAVARDHTVTAEDAS
jgi:Dockerin type I domain